MKTDIIYCFQVSTCNYELNKKNSEPDPRNAFSFELDI